MARALGIAGLLVSAVGLFLGFYVLSAHPATAFRIVAGSCVGIVGLLAFLRHTVFHRDDAARLGWATERPDWQYEVGFANLAFALMAGLAVCLAGDARVAGVVLAGYAAYLVQAAFLHLHRYLTDAERSPARLWRSVVATLVYAGMMGFFALAALKA